ncbi:uncharacterized protein LOC135848260 isoform X1 [Planococcus citri]|uniref:uncharacterized protein LOC135848260 isoform X1 n=1 Tax=Planococcus citri TaxID=170843 RepID=UPI0031F8084D
MDEMICDMTDATQPALISLQELSAITVAREIWRCEVNNYRTNNELEKLTPKKLSTSLKSKFRDLPTAIDNVIEKYVTKFGLSMENWLEQHYKRVFFNHYCHQNYVLEDFDDFVCDYSNGTVDYIKTAERMMRCDRLSKAKKFKIACTYFFENDIRRIWPFVCKKVGPNNIELGNCPQLYYWICFLRNELDKIPTSEHQSVDEAMFDRYMPYNRPSLEYFWNRISYQNQIQSAERLYQLKDEFFIRFILTKLDYQQLYEFVNTKGCDLICDLLRKRYFEDEFVLEIWMCMRNLMDEDNFTKLVVDMLQTESTRSYTKKIENAHNDHKNWLRLCRELWHNAPHDLRQSAIKNISTNLKLFTSYRSEAGNESSELLLTILECATFDERSSFWTNCWHNLILGKNTEDLQQIMEMCFENGDAIIQYKENVMLKSEHVWEICVKLLKKFDFEKLNDLVDFCCPNAETSRHFKQQLLLQSHAFDEKLHLRIRIMIHKCDTTQFDKFIDDAYENSDLAADYKNQFLASLLPSEHDLHEWIYSTLEWDWKEFPKFFETFVPTEQAMRQVKTRIIDRVKKFCRLSRDMLFYKPIFNDLLLWCLGNDEEVDKFKQENNILLN